MKKPQPKTLTVVCSVCGLDWTAHGENPSLEKCVELLLAELEKQSRWTIQQRSFSWPQSEKQSRWTIQQRSFSWPQSPFYGTTTATNPISSI